jgi:hypothetical protein
MLTQQQVTQLRTSAGLSPTPPAPTQTGSNDIIAQRRTALGMDTPTPPVAPPTKSLGDFSAEAIQGGVSKIGSSIQGGADKIAQGTAQGGFGGLGKVLTGVGESALGTASGFLQTVFSPLTATINKTADVVSNNPIVQKISQSGFGDAIAKGEQGFNDWASKHPELATNLSDALNVGMAALGDKLAGSPDLKLPDGTTLKNDLGNIKTKITDVVTGAKNKVVNTAGNIKEAISPTLTPEEAVGKIIQGKTTDIPAAQRTFATLPKDVVPTKMTSAELSDTIQTKIDSNMKQVDTHFTNDNTPHPMSDFTQTTGKGTSAVKTNYVQEAINGLKEHYTAIKDAQGLSDIKALEEKANTTGLTSKELNALAREQGTEIQSYKKNGDLASSQKAQAAENVRTGLKTTARETLAKTDPTAAAEVTRLDKETSDAIHTKDLLDTQAQREATGVQKKGKPNAIDRFAKNNPKTTKAIKYGATAVIGGEAIKHILP